VVGSLLVLIEVDRAWSWAAFIIIGREIAVMGLRAVAALEKATVPPSFWGKSKTTFQFVAIGFALIRSESEIGPFFLDEWLMLIAVLATVLSGWDYFRRYWSAFKSGEKVAIPTNE
jgi:CDP-diacylglycerol--glycerol-3-phosphate 3-phosphatidyltransferase